MSTPSCGARASFETPLWSPDVPVVAPLELYEAPVEPDWVDYNGHMTEAAFLTAFGWASDKFFRYIGIDEDYRGAGHSLYTVETHINYLREASLGEPLRIARKRHSATAGPGAWQGHYSLGPLGFTLPQADRASV